MSDSLPPHGLHGSMPGLPGLHCLLEFAQTHVHWFSDAIQWSHPLSPSSPALSLSQLRDLFQKRKKIYFPVSWLSTTGDQSIGASASVLPMNIQNWFPLGLTSLTSLLPKGLSRLFSTSTVWKHQFLVAQPSLWSNSHICTWLLGKPLLFSRSVMSNSLWPHGL